MVLAQPGQVNDALAFASRAWRRPLTATEKDGLRAFYQKARTVNNLDHEGAMRAVIARVLVSPAFLYRLETISGAKSSGEKSPSNTLATSATRPPVRSSSGIT